MRQENSIGVVQACTKIGEKNVYETGLTVEIKGGRRNRSRARKSWIKGI